MRHTIRIVLLALLLCIGPLFPIENAIANWKTARESLDHLHVAGHFRIFYTLSGANALPKAKQRDINGNGIPDYVDDIALQLETAEAVFVRRLGFQSPLQGLRYAGKLKAYDVHLLAMKGHGSSGDGIVTFHYHNVSAPSLPALTLTISNDLPTGNLSPAHEFFHAIQNGYTMFKNRWFTEGTARWSETAFASGTGTIGPLPEDNKALTGWLSQTYSASRTWNRLAMLCKTGDGHVPTSGLPINYVSHGTPIFGDATVNGAHFFVSMFENLGRAANIAAERFGRPPFKWSEHDQKSAANDPYLLCGIVRTISAHCTSSTSPELGNFLRLLHTRADSRCLAQLGSEQ